MDISFIPLKETKLVSIKGFQKFVCPRPTLSHQIGKFSGAFGTNQHLDNGWSKPSYGAGVVAIFPILDKLFDRRLAERQGKALRIRLDFFE